MELFAALRDFTIECQSSMERKSVFKGQVFAFKNIDDAYTPKEVIENNWEDNNSLYWEEVKNEKAR